MIKQKQYKVIVKVGDDKFLKYHSRDLLSLVRFLDKDYKDWRYFNVYNGESGEQIANYTKNNKPIHKRVLNRL